MLSDDPFKQTENANSNNKSSNGTKFNDLKTTIQKIVKANQAFLNKHQVQREDMENTNNKIAPPIEINPKEIVFENISPNSEYVLNFVITNQTKKQRKIKFVLPKSSYFTFENTDNVIIAPGLSLRCKIYCHSKSNVELKETFEVVSDDFKITVPVLSYGSRGKLIFEPSTDLGIVQVETPFSFVKTLSNFGTKDLSLDIGLTEEFNVTSDNFPLILSAGQTIDAKFEIIFPKVGIIDSCIPIICGSNDNRCNIDIKANVINSSHFIVNKNGDEVSAIEFGDILTGCERRKKVTLINNSPFPLKFKIQILKGIHTDGFKNEVQLQTPYDAGKELLEQVFFVEPSHGEIPSYGFMDIDFRLKTIPTQEEKYLVSRFSITDNTVEAEQISITTKRNYDYTAIFNFEENMNQKFLQIFASTYCPLVNFSQQEYNLGEVQIGETRRSKITIKNYSYNQPVDIVLPTKSYVHFEQSKISLKPNESIQTEAIFCPKNLGIFDSQLVFKVNYLFPVNIGFFGQCKMAPPSNKLNTNTQAGSILPHIIKPNKNNTNQSKMSVLNKGNQLRSSHSQLKTENDENINSTITQHTLNKLNIKQMRFGYSLPKMATKGNTKELKTSEAFNFVSDEYAPMPIVPKSNPPLFVTKPIKNNEPSNLRNLNYRFNPDPKQALKEFPSVVKDHEEAKQITEKLSGEKLMRILVGPTELNFGKVFVNSTASLYFQIKNDLWSSISASLYFENLPYLKETSFKTQIIPSGKIAGFKISLSSPVTKIIRENVSYIINGHHVFSFIVNAEIVPVDLDISKSQIYFKFKEESMEMSTSEIITIKNPGNCQARFIFTQNPHSPFKVMTPEGIINENSQKDIEIVYTPMNIKDEDIINLEIVNGISKLIKCTGTVNEMTSEIIGNVINFGTIAVGQTKTGSFAIKNTHNKYYAIYKLLESSVPEGVMIHQKFGKICPDDAQKIDFEFCLNKKVDYKNHEISFLIRGLGPIKVILSVSTIVPKIEIEQPFFNFEKVTFGNKACLPLTLTNKSQIAAELLLDLSSPNNLLQEKFNCLDIEYLQKSLSESIVFEKREGPAEISYNKNVSSQVRRNSIETNEFNMRMAKIASDYKKDVSDKGQRKSLKPGKIDNAKDSYEEPKNFIFYLKPNRTYNFSLIFSPSKPIHYDFDLIFYLPGQESDGSLIRKIKCIGTNPRFLMQPLNGVIEFPKKIILSSESVSQEMKVLSITNPSTTEALEWSINLSSIEEQKVFTITPSAGRIEPKTTLSLKIGFRPLKPQIYEAVIPFYIDNEAASHAEIKLKGEGSFPKVILSKEELILSPVPLGCTSIGYINFINDGYQNSTLIATIPPEYSKIGLSVEFVDGNLIGITHSDIRFKVTFSSTVPISFTAKIVIEDDLKRSFSFLVSGVADNSLLTHGPFIELGYFMQHVFSKSEEGEDSFLSHEYDNPINYAIKIDSNTKAPKLVNTLDKKSPEYDPKSNSYSELSDRSKNVDHEPKDVYSYYEQVANSICIWLMEYGITNISKFPDDLIFSNGQQLYELLEFLLKSPPVKTLPESNSKHIDRIKILIQNYNGLINVLKENNAMINMVRPYYLLGYKDLLIYFKNNQSPNVQADYYKISEYKFRTISMINWVTLFLQIIKIFFVSRMTVKDFKSAVLPLVDRKKPNIEKSLVKINDKTQKISKEPEQKVKNKLTDGKADKSKAIMPEDKSNSINPIELQNDNKDMKNLLSSIFPEYSYDKNKIYSQSEALILRWLEIAYHLKTKENVRIAGFGKELKNLLYFASVIDVYIGSESQISSKIKLNPYSSDDYSHNFDLMKHVLLEFGVKEELDENEFLNNNPISMLLFGLHLFKTLPYYLPRATVEFECSLHEKLQKEIVLSNPTNKTIIYSVKIFGHKNFTIENDLVKLEGKPPVPFPVTFYANTSLPVEGKIFFQNRRNGKSVAGAVVFNLRAKVTNRFSMKTFTITNVNLYEMSNSEIVVTNPFDKDVNFKIVVENLEATKENKTKTKSKTNQTTDESSINGEKKKSSLPMFFVKQDKLTIRKGASAKLYIQYFPVTFETHKCFIVFLDQRIGEMQYEIIGTPNPPLPLDSFRITTNIENYTSFEVNIPFKNSYLQNALMRISDKLKEFKEFNSLANVEKMMLNQENQFEIEISQNEFVTSSSQIINFNSKSNQASMKNNGNQESNNSKALNGNNNQNNAKQSNKNHSTVNNGQYKLNLMPIKKVPIKDLHVRLQLKGIQKFDQRVYDLYLTVIPKTVKALIEMKSTARVPIVQNIPITNNIDIECHVKPTFTGILNGHLFEVPQGMIVLKKKSVFNLPLKYNSQWIDKAEGKLMIQNTTTNDNFEYHIKAESEEPLSEDHIDLYTKAKKLTEIILKIRNPISESRNFKVDTDIPDAAYQKNIILDELKTIDFKLTFTPIIGGNFMYSVTFTDEMGRYFWHLVTLHVDSPEPSKVLNIVSEIRKPTILKIELENQKSKQINYKVVILGDYLSGDPTFELESYSKDTYQLFYFPLKIENSKKKIGFLSEEEGELWYDIECRSEESKPVKLPTFKAELGKWASQQVVLKNPLKKKTTSVVVDYNEGSNFIVNAKKFEIPPNESLSIEITYIPKELNKNENEIITFKSNEIGDWKYHVFGTGIPPTDFEPTTISTALGTSITKTLNFKNPYDHDSPFQVYIEAFDKSKDVFDIIVPKQKNNVIQSLSNFQIIVKFSPTEIFTYQARVIIKQSENLFWCFPLIGVTEAIQSYSEFVIRTKCGSEVETSNNYKLVGITNFNAEETFDYSIKVNHKESANIEKWLKIVPVKNKINSIYEELKFNFIFLPNKPFKTIAEFIISRSSGGRWKFKIHLEATDPDFFDTLNIVSQLNIKKIIHFRLFNSDKKNSSAFVAYFTQDSDSEFVVNPTKGILEPSINDGTILEVSYLPTQYGKAKTGILIVETDQFYWRFQVKGMFEKYIPPSFKKTKN